MASPAARTQQDHFAAHPGAQRQHDPEVTVGRRINLLQVLEDEENGGGNRVTAAFPHGPRWRQSVIAEVQTLPKGRKLDLSLFPLRHHRTGRSPSIGSAVRIHRNRH